MKVTRLYSQARAGGGGGGVWGGEAVLNKLGQQAERYLWRGGPMQ